MRLRLAARAVLATAFLPGVGICVVPYALLRLSGAAVLPPPSRLTIAAAALGVVAAGVLLHCIRGFAVHGRGTLAPIDPPTTLVVRGIDRYTRNPLYLSVLAVLLSQALFFRSAVLLLYAGISFLGLHLFVVRGEEPQLRARFGEAYAAYCGAVPRWGIAMRPFDGAQPRGP